MRKLHMILFSALLVIVLAACGNNETNAPANNNESASAENGEEVNAPDNAGEDKLDVEEVYEKVTVANAELESFATEMDMSQKMEVDGEVVDIASKLDMDVVQDPFSLKQTMTMDIPQAGKQEMESYLTEDGFFVFNPEEEQWMKLPTEFSDQIIQQSEQQADLQGQLAQFEGLKDGFTLDETEDEYILKFNSTDDDFDQVFKETIKNNIPEEMGLDMEMFENIQFNDVQYELFVKKDNFYMSELNMNMDYDMEVEGQKINSKQDIKTTYSKYNEIDEIIVPDEVIEEAVEMEL